MTFTYSSVSAVEDAGQAGIGAVATGATKDAITVTDRRGMLPVPTGAAELGDLADVDDTGAATGDVLTRKADGTYDLQAPAIPHIEAHYLSGNVSLAQNVTWATAFASAPIVTATADSNGFGGKQRLATCDSRSTTGATIYKDSPSGNNHNVFVIATEAT